VSLGWWVALPVPVPSPFPVHQDMPVYEAFVLISVVVPLFLPSFLEEGFFSCKVCSRPHGGVLVKVFN